MCGVISHGGGGGLIEIPPVPVQVQCPGYNECEYTVTTAS